jgi:predicted RNase H-like HicB family nuclease
MNKKAIAATALCRFDKKGKNYVVESPLFDRVVGVGRTEEEAYELFHELLSETYLAYLEGALVGYERRGRPAKGNVEFHAQIKPDVKDNIVAKAQALGISQGEVIAYFNALESAQKDLLRRYRRLKNKLDALNRGKRKKLSA